MTDSTSIRSSRSPSISPLPLLSWVFLSPTTTNHVLFQTRHAYSSWTRSRQRQRPLCQVSRIQTTTLKSEWHDDWNHNDDHTSQPQSRSHSQSQSQQRLQPSSSQQQQQQQHNNSNNKNIDNLIEVELRDVHLSYDGKSVINGLNLQIRRGESLAIIGISGTGKSTTLRLISGLILPTKGELLLRGRPRATSLTDILRSPLKALRAMQKNNNNNDDNKNHNNNNNSNDNNDASTKPPRISMVFQNAALFDGLTIAENVMLALQQHTTLKHRQHQDDNHSLESVAETWLQRVDLSDAINKTPEMLSGGMKKRASFARAVCFDPNDPSTAPDVLLYDEPTAGVDLIGCTRIENLIRDLRPYCATCVIVTHQVSTIRRTADRVVFLHDGRTVWDGSVNDLDTTDDPYIRQFMSSSLDGPLSVDSLP